VSTREEVLEAAADVLAHIAEELAFAEPGSSSGLVPLNALLMDLERLPVVSLPQAFSDALALPRCWIDAVLDGTATFDSAMLQRLCDWQGWAVDFLMSVAVGSAPPDLPGQLETFDARNATAVSAGDAPTMRLNLPADIELLREFHAESLELLRSVEQAVLTLERNPAATDAVNAVFRAFHTFKGSAGFLQLDALRDFAHELESLLELVRCGTIAVTPALVEAILAGADVLAECTRRVGAQVSGAEPAGPIPVPAASVQHLIAAASRGDVAAPAAPLPGQAVPAEPAPASAGVPAARDAVVDDRFVRLDAAKLDDLVNLVGELVVAQSFVLESPDVRGSPNLELAHAVRKLSRITRGLQHNALSLRMVPVGPLFRRMTRLVRDVAAARGKQVQLVLKGEDTELDRQLVEKLADPLIHMIRNAVDHGIEPPVDRLAAGKGATGTIELSAFHRHGGIVVRVGDDGRGIDPARLVARAIERKLLPPDARPEPQEALELVFLPGLSTADAVTDISGRGVGMDVVRGHIEALRGHVDISSTTGAGATFTLRLPLTLALIDGLIVGLGGQRFIIPALAVRETFRPRPGQVAAVHEHGEMVEARGQSLPVLRLGRLLQRPARVNRPEEGVLLVLESGSARVALLVDEILGKQEVVIKNMGEAFAGQTLVSGGAILGDGMVGLILDVESLIRLPRAPIPMSSSQRLQVALP
jgi:two-component system chemotaxis sensor kinase CheA